MQEKDEMREMCIKQGYVPSTCTLAGMMIWGLVNKGEHPCDGCNANRDICKGKRKEYIHYNEQDKLFSFLDKWDEAERREREERARKYQKELDERKASHLLGYNNSIMEVRMDMVGYHKTRIEIVVKDVSNERAYVSVCETIPEMQQIVQMAFAKYRMKQVHIETNGYGQAIYDAIFQLKLPNLDIVPLSYVKMRFDY